MSEDAPQRSAPKLLVIRDDHAAIGVLSIKNHMAASLPIKHEASSLESLLHLSP
jgi:hypothetical protein